MSKALVRSKILAALALALMRKICALARAHAQFFQLPALALKTFWAPLNFALILWFWKALIQRLFRSRKAFLGYISPIKKIYIFDIEKKFRFLCFRVNFLLKYCQRWLHFERKNERLFALALSEFGCARAQRSLVRIWAALSLALRSNEPALWAPLNWAALTKALQGCRFRLQTVRFRLQTRRG